MKAAGSSDACDTDRHVRSALGPTLPRSTDCHNEMSNATQDAFAATAAATADGGDDDDALTKQTRCVISFRLRHNTF